MRRLYYLLFIPLAFCLSCINNPRGNRPDNIAKPDSLVTAKPDALKKEDIRYRPVDVDTAVFEKDLSLYGKPCHLKISSYSLNDSGVRVTLEDSTVVIHNTASRIILTHNGLPVIDKTITKASFKDSISDYIIRMSTLENVTFEFARTNRLYFKCWLSDESGKQEIEFAIFYQGPRRSELNYWRGLTVYY